MTEQTVKALGTLPVKVWGVAKAIVGVQDRAPPTARSASSAAAGSPARPSPRQGFPLDGQGRLPADADRRLQLLHRHVQLHPAAAARRRPHRRRPLGGASAAGSPGCAAGPTPGYVDVAKLLPIAYVVAGCLLVMGVVLIVGDLVVPLHVYS